MELHEAPTCALSPEFLGALRSFLDAAFEGEFSGDDWSHACGGIHVWVGTSDTILSHGSLVERRLQLGERRLRAGYVEAVATREDVRRCGHGTAVLRRLGERIVERHELGVLSTGEPTFYERLGWKRWQGTTAVAGPRGRGWTATPEDDDSLMILRTPRDPDFALTGNLIADWRMGDAW